MKFVSEVTERGVSERRFDLQVGENLVPGLLWAPEGARGPRPLVLIGHGGTQHKRVPNVLSLARRLVRHHGYAAIAIDAPEHGDRITPEEAARARERGPRPIEMTPEAQRRIASRSALAVTEWKATLDAAQSLDYVGDGKVGYWGVSMGTMFGVPFVAAEPRVQVAIFGLMGLRPGAELLERAAQSITIALLFMFQLHDELMKPESGLALFAAFGSKVKSMHINPGSHVGTPLFEREYYETFFQRHLGAVEASPSAADKSG
jgi:dienelactone hydrolase